MIFYRLSHAKYADRLNSSGVANRWNRPQQFVIYASEHISLCALELLAHTNGIRPAGMFKILEIEVIDKASVIEVSTDQLPVDWHMLSSYATTQSIGSQWYDSKSSLILKVPSAIIKTEHNLVINTQHPDFDNMVQLKAKKNFFWDDRFPEK